MSTHADTKEGGGWVFQSECPPNCLVWQVGGAGSASHTGSEYGEGCCPATTLIHLGQVTLSISHINIEPFNIMVSGLAYIFVTND